jgi:hypothetical protein
MILYLVFGAIGFLIAGFTGVAIGVLVAFIVDFFVAVLMK